MNTPNETSDDRERDARNQRRADLIRKQTRGGLSDAEAREISRLQAERIAYAEATAGFMVAVL